MAQQQQHQNEVPKISSDAVLVESESLPNSAQHVKGYSFDNDEVDYDELFKCYAATGFQATHLGQAIGIVNDMLNWKPSNDQVKEGVDANAKCKIFMGYTSGMVSSGVRETIRYLVKNKMVDVLVSTGGGIEEDLMKCLAPTAVGEFTLKGEYLRKKGLNRIGNLLVPNNNYCVFQDWLFPILNDAYKIQEQTKTFFTPSSLIKLLGERIDDEDSILYWAAKNDIPVFCPAITDGAIGDVIFFHSYKTPGFVLDLVQDIRRVNKEAIGAPCSGMIILGGGVVKHHVANANLMRNGADFAVYINTANEFDGSDAGASTDEAVSWGKIKAHAKRVKVFAEATLVFPILVAQTFVKHRAATKKNVEHANGAM